MSTPEPAAEEVVRNIREIALRCQQAVPVLDAEGNQTGEYRFDAANALRGFELIGKYLGLFRERVEISLPQSAAEIEAELLQLRTKRLGRDVSDIV